MAAISWGESSAKLRLNYSDGTIKYTPTTITIENSNDGDTLGFYVNFSIISDTNLNGEEAEGILLGCRIG